MPARALLIGVRAWQPVVSPDDILYRAVNADHALAKGGTELCQTAPLQFRWEHAAEVPYAGDSERRVVKPSSVGAGLREL